MAHGPQNSTQDLEAGLSSDDLASSPSHNPVSSWRALFSIAGLRAAVHSLSSSFNSVGGAVSGEARSEAKPSMLPLITLFPGRLAAQPGVHNSANMLDGFWLTGNKLARTAPPSARVAVVGYLLLLHLMSWLALVWRHCR